MSFIHVPPSPFVNHLRSLVDNQRASDLTLRYKPFPVRSFRLMHLDPKCGRRDPPLEARAPVLIVFFRVHGRSIFVHKIILHLRAPQLLTHLLEKESGKHPSPSHLIRSPCFPTNPSSHRSSQPWLPVL